MTIIGILLALVGIIALGLIMTGNAPDFLVDLGAPMWVWVVALIIGLALVVLNRRTAD